MSPPVFNNPHKTPQYDPQYNPCEKFGVKGGPAFWRPQFQLSLESFKAPKMVLLAAENAILSVLQLGTQHLDTMQEYKDETLPESSREPAKGLPHLPKPSRPFTPLKPPSASEHAGVAQGVPAPQKHTQGFEPTAFSSRARAIPPVYRDFEIIMLGHYYERAPRRGIAGCGGGV